jgi:FtsH Extracellular
LQIKREHQINFWYIIAAFMAVLLIQNLLLQQTHTKTIPYSEFQQLVDQGKVTDLRSDRLRSPAPTPIPLTRTCRRDRSGRAPRRLAHRPMVPSSHAAWPKVFSPGR